MKLGEMILNEVPQAQEDKCLMFFLICGSDLRIFCFVFNLEHIGSWEAREGLLGEEGIKGGKTVDYKTNEREKGKQGGGEGSGEREPKYRKKPRGNLLYCNPIKNYNWRERRTLAM